MSWLKKPYKRRTAFVDIATRTAFFLPYGMPSLHPFIKVWSIAMTKEVARLTRRTLGHTADGTSFHQTQRSMDGPDGRLL
ncbi:hypothetical protein BaRGS_00007823 [Batillaria attramentaria]|uniref:Uncharacterized protein n=1 Tax=Batillaria attramentaria TaxID=370345 RepID=A0ABD0LPM5_9CAEN